MDEIGVCCKKEDTGLQQRRSHRGNPGKRRVSQKVGNSPNEKGRIQGGGKEGVDRWGDNVRFGKGNCLSG